MPPAYRLISSTASCCCIFRWRSQHGLDTSIFVTVQRRLLPRRSTHFHSCEQQEGWCECTGPLVATSRAFDGELSGRFRNWDISDQDFADTRWTRDAGPRQWRRHHTIVYESRHLWILEVTRASDHHWLTVDDSTYLPQSIPKRSCARTDR